jgi:condensin complex subunit 1
MAVLALCKFMCVSEKFCEGNLSLLLSLLEKATDPHTRSNIIVALGDIAVCFNNLIDQNISHLYHRLNDADQIVKKNALMVLTHLILNGMVKVKGQISLMAKCIEDEDVKISDLAKLFFAELSQKDNAIYNNLPDIISSLSAQQLDDGKFRNIMRYLFNFIDKVYYIKEMFSKKKFHRSDKQRTW